MLLNLRNIHRSSLKPKVFLCFSGFFPNCSTNQCFGKFDLPWSGIENNKKSICWTDVFCFFYEFSDCFKATQNFCRSPFPNNSHTFSITQACLNIIFSFSRCSLTFWKMLETVTVFPQSSCWLCLCTCNTITQQQLNKFKII